MPALSETGTYPDREPQPSRLPFREMLEARQKSVNSLLCVGLDPDPTKIPDWFKSEVSEMPLSSEDPEGPTVQHEYDLLVSADKKRNAENFLGARVALEYMIRIVDEVHQDVSAFKPNIALFERYLSYGVDAADKLIQHIREVDPTIPVILDAKRADIGATNEGYAEMFDDIDADAITVSPYFGVEGPGALDPFLIRTDKGIIILCRTTNPEAAMIQDAMVINEEYGTLPLFALVAHMAESARQKVNPNVCLVVSAKTPEQGREIRAIFKGPFLMPGLGRQGGQSEDLIASFDENGAGIIGNNSSAVTYASSERDCFEAAGREAKSWKNKINAVRPQAA